MKRRVTILIPAYNEQAVLPQLFERLYQLQDSLPRYQLEFLFINDGSRDKTLRLIQQQAAKHASVAYVNLARNFGKETAMLAGFDHA